MFFYLFYNSSFSFIVERRLFSTILYGSILYILTHAVLNYCDVSILNIINNYYWTIFSLDIISFTYAIYQSMNDESFGNDSNSNSTSTSSNSNFNVSFNLLKNKINTLLDRKNDLTITHIPIPPSSSTTSQLNRPQQNKEYNNKHQQQHQQQQQQYYDNHNHNQESQEDNQYQDSLQIPNSYNNQNVTILSSSSNKFSTPISQLQNKNNKTNKPMNTTKGISNTSNTSKASSTSTPISIIRNSIDIDIEDPFIIDNNDNYDYNNSKNGNNGNNVNSNNESIAGSDVGSIMDLEDFESSL